MASSKPMRGELDVWTYRHLRPRRRDPDLPPESLTCELSLDIAKLPRLGHTGKTGRDTSVSRFYRAFGLTAEA